MSKTVNWIKSKLFWLRTGYGLEVVNEGNPVKQIVIRFKDHYIEVMLDVETGEPVNFGWADDPSMFHVPLREHYLAVPQTEYESKV